MALHIIPLNDLKEHTEESTCECYPKLIIENGEMIFIHNSYDGREITESKFSKKVINLYLKENEV